MRVILLALIALAASTSSPFCDHGMTASYDDLLGSAQHAFQAKNYQKSKNCYLTALHRYWKEFDNAMKPTLDQVDRLHTAHLAASAAKMQAQLSQLVAGHAETGSPVMDEQDPQREPEQHMPGPHPVPPGSVPAIAALPQATLSLPKLRQSFTTSLPGRTNDALIDDSAVRHLSSLPRRQQIRALQRMANDRLQLMHQNGDGAARSGAYKGRQVAPRGTGTAEQLEQGWA